MPRRSVTHSRLYAVQVGARAGESWTRLEQEMVYFQTNQPTNQPIPPPTMNPASTSDT